MSFVAAGAGSKIVQELQLLVAEQIIPFKVSDRFAMPHQLPIADRYVYAAGYLAGKRVSELYGPEVEKTLALNLVNAIRFAEAALQNAMARVCILGSMSGTLGSFDELYAAAKAGLHGYCAAKELKPTQQLIVICPPLLSDAGMTVRRPDFPDVLYRRQFCTSRDVAAAIQRELWGPDKMNGLLLIHPKRGPLMRAGEGKPC